MGPQNNKIKLKAIFGWSTLVWYEPFRKITDSIPKSPLRIIELGAGPYSQVALFFDHADNALKITSYPEKNIPKIKVSVAEKQKTFCLSAEIDISCVSAFECGGRYDLIILKSVLGGLFRTNATNSADAMDFIDKLVARNLNDGGAVLTLDNGYSAFEPLLKGFGARKNYWRRFKTTDFTGFSKQECFGFFSCFSFSTRLGRAGEFIENVLFGVDYLLHKLGFHRSPTVIATLFKKTSQ